MFEISTCKTKVTVSKKKSAECVPSRSFFQKISVILPLSCLCAGDGQSAAAVRGCLTSCSGAFGLGSAPLHRKPGGVDKHHQENGQHCNPAERFPVSDKAAAVAEQWGEECECLVITYVSSKIFKCSRGKGVMGRDDFEPRFFQAECAVKRVLSYLLSVKVRNQVEMKHFNAHIIIKKAVVS